MPSSKADAASQTENENVNDLHFDEKTITLDRRHPNSDRRSGDANAIDTGVMENSRRKKQRRRHIDPTTCERDYSDPEIEFMRAMDDYKRRSGRMFPTCSEVLEVIRELGYIRLTPDQLDLLQLNSDDQEFYDSEWDPAAAEESAE